MLTQHSSARSHGTPVSVLLRRVVRTSLATRRGSSAVVIMQKGQHDNRSSISIGTMMNLKSHAGDRVQAPSQRWVLLLRLLRRPVQTRCSRQSQPPGPRSAMPYHLRRLRRLRHRNSNYWQGGLRTAGAGRHGAAPSLGCAPEPESTHQSWTQHLQSSRFGSHAMRGRSC